MLATADRRGRPSARYVLLKEATARGFVFYTNDNSRKGDEMRANERVALVFYWDVTGKQVRIEGKVSRAAGRRGRRLLAGAADRQPLRVGRLRAEPPDRVARAADARATRAGGRVSRTATSRARRTGRATSSCPTRSSSGPAPNRAFTSASCSRAHARRGQAGAKRRASRTRSRAQWNSEILQP